MIVPFRGRCSEMIWLASVVLAMLLVGCGERQQAEAPGEPSREQTPRSTNTGDLLAQRGDLDARQVIWSSGDASSTARGYFRGAMLVYIDEDMDRGEYGDTREEYLLHDNQLIHFRRTGSMLIPSPDDEPVMQEIETEVLFNPDGSARVVRNLAGRVDHELTPAELEGIRTHFAQIRDRLAAAHR